MSCLSKLKISRGELLDLVMCDVSACGWALVSSYSSMILVAKIAILVRLILTVHGHCITLSGLLTEV